MSDAPTKLTIVVRTDLRDKKGQPVGLGKLGAQIGHACHWWLTEREGYENDTWCLWPTEEEQAWLTDGLSRKILLEAHSEQQLRKLHQQALEAGLTSHLVVDQALTVFAEPTVTVLAIGPHYADRIDPVTKSLRLWT